MSSRASSHLLPALDSDVEEEGQSFLSDLDDALLAQPLLQLPPNMGLPATMVSSLSWQDRLAPRRQGTPDGDVGAVMVGHNTSAVSGELMCTFGYRH